MNYQVQILPKWHLFLRNATQQEERGAENQLVKPKNEPISNKIVAHISIKLTYDFRSSLTCFQQ